MFIKQGIMTTLSQMQQFIHIIEIWDIYRREITVKLGSSSIFVVIVKDFPLQKSSHIYNQFFHWQKMNFLKSSLNNNVLQTSVICTNCCIWDKMVIIQYNDKHRAIMDKSVWCMADCHAVLTILDDFCWCQRNLLIYCCAKFTGFIYLM